MHASAAQGGQETAQNLHAAAGRPRLAVPPRYSRGRRILELADALASAAGGWDGLTTLQAAAVRRAAELVTIAEAARAKHLQGDQSISLEDLIRLDGAADRAVRRLGIRSGAESAPRPPSLDDIAREILAEKQGGGVS